MRAICATGTCGPIKLHHSDCETAVIIISLLLVRLRRRPWTLATVLQDKPRHSTDLVAARQRLEK